MSRLTCSIGPDKIYGRLCAALPHMYINRHYLPMRLTAGLVCQCLSMIMFDYASQCVYIWIKYRFRFGCARMPTYVFQHTFIYVYVYIWLRRRKVACGKLVPLRAAAGWTCAAAKENCGRKSLLIEHEACHLKLESSETQKPQQAGICAALY